MNELWEFLDSRKKITLSIVIVNILVFLLLSVKGDTQDGYFMLTCGACFTPAILAGEYYRLFTGMFLHFGLEHLIYNMLCLIFMGDILEQILGSIRYVTIYLAGGLAGNLLSMAMDLHSGEYAVSAGASGAIFAVLGALLYVMIRKKGRLGTISFPRMAAMAVLSLLQGFTETGTDNAAHVGGFVMGFILAVLLYHKNKKTEITVSF